MFAAHVEDFNLASINYMHYGSPKFWYCMGPKEGRKLETYVKSRFPEAFVQCPEYMRHKTVLVNPYELVDRVPGTIVRK